MRGVGRGPVRATFARAIIRNIGHRAWTVQRLDGDEILETVGAHLLQGAAIALRFKGEHAGGIAARDHVIGFLIVHRQRGKVDGDALQFQEFQGAVEHGERGEAEEVEFHEPRLLDIFHRELRDEQSPSVDLYRAAQAR